MSQRASVYTVRIRSRSTRGPALRLGDFDGDGASLLAVLGGYLADFSASAKDGSRIVRSLGATVDGDDLFAVVQHGQNGIAADIVDPGGDIRLRQLPDDLQLVRHGCLFRLPPDATAGLLAVHVNNGRGMKELFEQGLIARFRAQFPALALAIERVAQAGVLRDAVTGNRIDKVRLVRLERPGSRTIKATDKWVGAAVTARVELDVAAAPTGARVQPALIQRYLDGDGSAFAEIVEFEGMTFDQARVEVLLPDDTRRLFDIAHPDASRPLTLDMPGIRLDADGEPTGESLLAELRAVLAAVGT